MRSLLLKSLEYRIAYALPKRIDVRSNLTAVTHLIKNSLLNGVFPNNVILTIRMATELVRLPDDKTDIALDEEEEEENCLNKQCVLMHNDGVDGVQSWPVSFCYTIHHEHSDSDDGDDDGGIIPT
ncbi:unnamed protein product [Echinostoma caproni]|uniref:Uncharacterized protein n=1 Tax=Echinostoma caproni TaxID=27848 RepID=A0A183AD04_9TREM|nr:unnamed protein product [Echinostoma caproni]